MFDINFILYKLNTNINYIINMWSNININIFADKKKDDGYTIISKNNMKYLSYEELWEDSD
jgi:hypothetical protein